MEPIGIYIHIPFCIRKCAYCDFLSFSGKENYYEAYAEALINEITCSVYAGCSVDTIFIGGGTPSLIDSCLIGKILNVVRSRFNVLEGAEITIEGNPDSLTFDKMRDYLSFGINRLSMGVQSLDESALHLMGRVHSGERAVQAFFDARSAGFKNVNVDLIFGIPGDDREAVCETIKKVVGLHPEHISAYSLIVEEGTKICAEIESRKLPEPDDNIDRSDYYYVCDYLKQSGYIQYEISNFSLPDFSSKHNIRYWKQREYVGFGLGSSSFMNGKRFSNCDNLQLYIDNNGIAEYREDTDLTLEELMDEFMMLGFRMISGPDMNLFREKFGVDPLEKYRDRLLKLQNLGLITECFALTKKGLDFANLIFEEFVV